MVRVAACQLPLNIENQRSNLEIAIAATVKAASDGAKIIVLPELLNSGYAFKNREEARSLAITIDHSVFNHLTQIAKTSDAIIVGGFALLERGRLRNASVIIDKDGVRGRYHKAHLFGDEPDFFEKGDMQPLLVDTPYGRLGTMICYDIEFPEWVRKLAISGAQIMAVPTNWLRFADSGDAIPMEVVRLQSAASVNKMVAIAADRTGSERGTDWVSASAIADCDGVIKAIADQGRCNELQILLVDVEIPLDHKIGPRNDLLADRRLDLY